MRMKRSLSFVFVLSLLMVGCNNDSDLGGNVLLGADGITISMSGWNKTRAYSRYDLTTPDLSVGEAVCVMDENGCMHTFYVVDEDLNVDDSNHNDANQDDNNDNKTDDGTNDKEEPTLVDGMDGETIEESDYGSEKRFVLKNPDVELTDGMHYRVVYPPHGDDGQFMLALGFGSYEGTPSLDWMVSGWQAFDSSKPFHFDLKRINSALAFDVVAPFDAQVKEMRVVCEQEAMFCIKGAFDSRPEEIYPERTAWTSQYKFPHKDMTWVQGEHYSLVLTAWPYDYSTQEYTLYIYTSDDRCATTPISIPNLLAGDVAEYQISDFEIFPTPVYKDVIEEERKGYDDVTLRWVNPGESY